MLLLGWLGRWTLSNIGIWPILGWTALMGVVAWFIDRHDRKAKAAAEFRNQVAQILESKEP